MTRSRRNRTGAEDTHQVLSAVARAAGKTAPVRLRNGSLLVTTAPHTRQLLTDPTFALPFNVRRMPLTAAPTNTHRSRPLPPAAVSTGTSVFAQTLDHEISRVPLSASVQEPVVVDTMSLLRVPAARAATNALLPDLSPDHVNEIADRTLTWLDALLPVAAAHRTPTRLSPVRRREHRAHEDLLITLTNATRPSNGNGPALHEVRNLATLLVAGVQVPVAAGSWLLVLLATHPHVQDALRDDDDLAMPVVWETLRLRPPTWLLPRVSTRRTRLGDTDVPAYTVAMASPLTLSRLPELVPGPADGAAALDLYDPTRWVTTSTRPGAWLPFGAGPHACPGRNLALAQLRHLALWSRSYLLEATGPVDVDPTRGLTPHPATVALRAHP